MLNEHYSMALHDMGFGSLSDTSFQSVFKTEIIHDACVKWGEVLCSRLSGNKVKGPDEWRFDRWERGTSIAESSQLSKNSDLL